MTSTLYFEAIHLPHGIGRTTAVIQMESAVSTAVSSRKPVLVWGDPGVGKTAAALNAAKTANAAFMTVSATNKDPEGLYMALVAAFPLYPMRISRSRLGFECESLLRGQNRPLIVDEYQNFEARTLRELMHLQEQCGFPLIAVGNASRIARVRPVDATTYEQIATRWQKPFVKIFPPTIEDLWQVANLYRVSDASAFGLLREFSSGRNLREVQEILAAAAILKSAGPVSFDDLATTICGQYGVEDPSDAFHNKPVHQREPDTGEAQFRQQRKRA